MSEREYAVIFNVFASTVVKVRAGSKAEARSLAEAKVYCPSVCHQCSAEVEIGDVGEIVEVQEIGGEA